MPVKPSSAALCSQISRETGTPSHPSPLLGLFRILQYLCLHRHDLPGWWAWATRVADDGYVGEARRAPLATETVYLYSRSLVCWAAKTSRYTCNLCKPYLSPGCTRPMIKVRIPSAPLQPAMASRSCPRPADRLESQFPCRLDTTVPRPRRRVDLAALSRSLPRKDRRPGLFCSAEQGASVCIVTVRRCQGTDCVLASSVHSAISPENLALGKGRHPRTLSRG